MITLSDEVTAGAGGFTFSDRTIAVTCTGKIYPPGVYPFNPGSIPDVEFDCSYLNGFLYKRIPLE